MSPRHILTPEERLKGGKTARAKLAASGTSHKLTSADSRKGALAVHAYARTIGVHHGHALTLGDRRRGGLATAAKRRKERERALVTLALPAKRGSESEFIPKLEVAADVPATDPVTQAPALGASLAGKLMAGEGLTPAERWPAHEENDPTLMGPPPPDPFTLSALKRFRLGPLSPLALTRSMRAQVDLMIKDGWLMATGDSMLALTEKGRQAIETEEVDHG